MSFLLISVVHWLGCESANLDHIVTHKSIFVLALNISNPGRVWFAGISFRPENAYAASDSRLWRIIPAVGVPPYEANDEVKNERVLACDTFSNQMSDSDKAECKIAGAFHPNVEGAKMYADSIIDVVLRFLPWWSPWGMPTSGSSVPAKTLDVSMTPDPSDPNAPHYNLPGMPPNRRLPSTIIINAKDHATGAAVDAIILIGGKAIAQTGHPFSFTFLCIRARMGTGDIIFSCPPIQVVAPEYSIAWVDYF